MGRQIDYTSARAALDEAFAEVESKFRQKAPIEVSSDIEAATATLLNSSTQAFREALPGCVLAKMIDPKIDIRLPCMNQGEDAFNGRTLDERVII